MCGGCHSNIALQYQQQVKMVLICQFEPLVTVLFCVHVHMCVCEILRWPQVIFFLNIQQQKTKQIIKHFCLRLFSFSDLDQNVLFVVFLKLK